MTARAPYRTQERRERERVYRRRMAVAVVASLALHACAFIVIERTAPSLPIVRQVGYPGPTRILPEISVEREPGPEESEGAVSAGPAGGEFYRVVPIEVVDWEIPSGEGLGEETERASADAQRDDEPVFFLDLSRPQPTSDLVAFEHFVLPVYPRSTLEKGLQGRVVIRTHVTPTGVVDDVRVVRSELDAAAEMEAVRAASLWRFRPVVMGGKPTAVVIETSIWFRFRDEPGRVGADGD
ncbi:MAG: TonB family protein [Candidatus Eisenbacteria bacterium]|nr:TonB family protein [Candidatus Eisenbacteria bacterium]